MWENTVVNGLFLFKIYSPILTHTGTRRLPSSASCTTRGWDKLWLSPGQGELFSLTLSSATIAPMGLLGCVLFYEMVLWAARDLS